MPVDPFSFVIAGVAVAGAAVILLRSAGARRRAIARFREIAKSYRGTIIEPGSDADFPSIFISIAPVLALVDTVTLGHDVRGTKKTVPRVCARYACGAGPRFHVFEEGLLASLGKILGEPDIKTEDERFDAIFVVKAKNAEATQTAWTQRARTLMLRAKHGTRVEADGRTVRVIGVGTPERGAEVDAMIELAVELASYGSVPLLEIGQFEEGRFVPASGSWESPTSARAAIETERGTIDVVCDARQHPPLLDLRIARRRGTEPFSITLRTGRPVELPRDLASEGVGLLVSKVEPATLAGDDTHIHVTLEGDGVVARIPAAARLLVEITREAPSAGVFR